MKTAVAAAVAAVVALLVWPGDARAQDATVSEVGWWSRNPAAMPPPGGFQVAQAPDGDLSVSAIRIRVSGTSLLTARLSIVETQVVGTPTVQVCRTAATWTAGPHAGDFNAPERDCASPVPLARNEAAREWTADVLPLLTTGGDVSLMAVPAPDPANPTPLKAPFQVDFGSAQVLATGGEVPSSDTGVGGGGGEVASGDFSLPVDSGLSVAPSSAPSDLSVPAFTAPPDLNPAQAPAAAAPAQVPGRFPIRPATDDGGGGADTPWGRLPLVMLGAAAIGATTAFARQRLQALGWLPSG